MKFVVPLAIAASIAGATSVARSICWAGTPIDFANAT